MTALGRMDRGGEEVSPFLPQSRERDKAQLERVAKKQEPVFRGDRALYI